MGELLSGEVHGLPLGEECYMRGSNPRVAHPDSILEVRADLLEHLLVELDVFVDLPNPPPALEYRRPCLDPPRSGSPVLGQMKASRAFPTA